MTINLMYRALMSRDRDHDRALAASNRYRMPPPPSPSHPAIDSFAFWDPNSDGIAGSDAPVDLSNETDVDEHNARRTQSMYVELFESTFPPS